MSVTLRLGDCLDVMKSIPSSSVDMVLADLPYGTTACTWDVVIPLNELWTQYKRIIKDNAPVVLFATQPFTSVLVTSNIKWFKHAWTWDKKTAKGHLIAKYRPMQQTEDICVFGKGRVNYYPIMTKRDKPAKMKEYHRTEIMGKRVKTNYEGIRYEWYPKTLLHFPWSPTSSYHPTEKPVELLRYLIRTYTQEGETVLDNTMGSGSTGVACVYENRDFIGIEKEQKYFDAATFRTDDAKAKMNGQMSPIQDNNSYDNLPMFAIMEDNE